MLTTSFAAALTSLLPRHAEAYESSVTLGEVAQISEAAAGAEVYFGNGCFWGRQHEFVEAERRLGRNDDTITSLVGYAGGAGGDSDGKVCYYYGRKDTIYERLGHGEVVNVKLSDNSDQAAEDLEDFAETYFKNFRKVPGLGMQRLDPQDAGPGYRNMIGLPGGMDSPLLKVIQKKNVNNMKMVKGSGNAVKGDSPSEDDVFNSIWIYDSDALPFYPAEVYHQFHDGLGYKFPTDYTFDLKKNALKRKLIKETGCPEMRERRFAEFESLDS